MASIKTCDSGKVERPVRMDYSGTYRENDRLEQHLDEQLVHLKHSFHRMLSWKDEALETARADADKILRLKEAVNRRQETEEEEEEDEPLTILCQSSKNPWRRKSSGMSSASSRRSMSAGTVGSVKRISVVSGNLQDSSVEEADGVEEEGSSNTCVMNYSSPFSTQDIKKVSVTERRLAKEREQFSAKNLFNVRRKTSFRTLESVPKRSDLSPDTPRTAIPTSTLPNPLHSLPGNRQARPKTSPAAYGKRSASRTRGYSRPTTALSSRLNGSLNDGEDDGFSRPPRRPRSRRELQKLVELKLDPFEEEEGEDGGGGVPEKSEQRWESCGDRHQDLLHSLQAGRVQLQARVSTFLRTLEEFNRRGHKSGLDQILEAS